MTRSTRNIVVKNVIKKKNRREKKRKASERRLLHLVMARKILPALMMIIHCAA